MLLVDPPGSPQAMPLLVLTGHPGAQEVHVGTPAVEVLQVELSLQLQGECLVLALLLDLTDVVLIKRLLAD